MKKIYIGIICASLMLIVSNIAQAAEGDVWITPTTQEIGANTNFDIDVHIDTGGKNLGAFNMYLDFDASKVTIDTTQGSDGISKTATTINYSVLANPNDISNNHYRFAGIHQEGIGGNDVHVVTIHAKTTANFTDSVTITPRISELSNELGHALNSGNMTYTTIINPQTQGLLYRFWSKKNKSHFYTANEEEKNYIIAHYDEYTWKYEGVANDVFTTQVPNSTPVYRFWSKKNKGHFYTASEEEKNYVINHYDDYVWKYEGIAYYAYSTQQSNTKPVYRFWSKKNRHHFYTASEDEKNYVISHYDDYVWKYEGMAWYVME